MAQEPHANRTPLRWWANLVADHPRWVVSFTLLVALVCLPVATGFRDHLSVGGWLPPQAQAVQVDHLLDQEFGRHTTSHYLLVHDRTGQLTVDDHDFQREMARVLAQVRGLPGVTTIHTWQSILNADVSDALVSRDRTATIAIVTVDTDVREATARMPDLQRAIANDVLLVEVGGWPAVTQDFQSLTSRDLARAELISLPIAIVLLVMTFGGVLLAGLPVLTTVLALAPTLAVLTVLSRYLETSIFAANLVLMLGLAIGIDYALILINRYREELGRSERRQALITTIEHAGRTVIASGAAVITGLVGLLAIGTPAATSTALAAMVAVLCGVGAALTMLPAALVLMGSRLQPRRGTGYLPWCWLGGHAGSRWCRVNQRWCW
jgi:RND superfamily putative drug exporter